MTRITYTVGEDKGFIYWAIAEQFKELEGRIFNLSKMDALQIEKMDNLSTAAKILLSAVAGAVIQHLIDEGVEVEFIFSTGYFEVEI